MAATHVLEPAVTLRRARTEVPIARRNRSRIVASLGVVDAVALVGAVVNPGTGDATPGSRVCCHAASWCG
jgi:hypothetical protein